MKLLQHPAENELIEFLTERLDQSATDSVEGHLDQCPECQAKIDSIVDNLVLSTRNEGPEIIEGTNSKGMQLELARALIAQDEDSKAKLSEGVIILKRLTEASPEWTRPKAILKRLEAQAQSDQRNQSEEDR